MSYVKIKDEIVSEETKSDKTNKCQIEKNEEQSNVQVKDEVISEEESKENNSESKEVPLWEKLYDAYNNNKDTITILSICGSIGGLVYGAFSQRQAAKTMDIMEKNIYKNMQSLENRLTETVNANSTAILSVVPPLNQAKELKQTMDTIEKNIYRNMDGLENRLVETIEATATSILSLTSPLCSPLCSPRKR
eukprot:472982_1